MAKSRRSREREVQRQSAAAVRRSNARNAARVRGKAPTRPPYGSYDPALDQQEAAANRGLGDLISDIGRENSRAAADYEIGKSDLSGFRARNLESLFTSRARGKEDYDFQVEGLLRDYRRLGNTQRQQQGAAGVMGGAAIQAQRKRAENQEIDRRPMDTNFQRFMADSALAEKHVNEDYDRDVAGLSLGYTRGVEDRNLVTLPRAERENVIYGEDVNELRIDQAKQSGLLPYPTPKAPKKPKKPARGRGRVGTVRNIRYGVNF